MKEQTNFTKPPSGYSPDATERRKQWVEEHTSVALDGNELPSTEDLQGIIEYHAGYVPVPMAVVGPLLIDGSYAQGRFIVPVCTVEGALAISMCRGMLATASCGGIRTKHIRQQLSRSPVFIVKDIHKISEFLAWIDRHHEEIKEVAESTTRYGKLLRIEPHVIHKWIILDMIFDTGNAAGQNMVTLASDHAGRFISAKTGAPFILESGFNSDKKPSWKNLLKGRGHYVISEVVLEKQVLKRLLHTTAEDMNQLQDISLSVKHAIGTIGAYLNIANALTGIYMATGQDVACSAENSVGHLQVKPQNGDLHVSLTLPSLTVGTVGGGTRLPVQKKNLDMLDCYGADEFSARKLAEIIAASTLALEISLLSSIVSNTFTSAHIRYGREGKEESK